MDNGKWIMENGQWKMGNAELRTQNAKRKTRVYVNNAFARVVHFPFSIGLLLMCSCTLREPIKPSNEDPFTDAPLHLSYNVRVLFTDSTTKKAVLTAGEARLYEDRKQTLLGNHVHVDFFDAKSQRRVAELDADSAEIDDRSRNMTAIGNVRVWSDSSRTTLTTSRLLWNDKTQRVSTNEVVHIVSPTETIDGKGLESDQFLSSYRIFKVSGVHKP